MTKAEELRKEAAECFAREERSFERCDTDGFLSQWANNINGQLKLKQAEIEDNGGMWEFWGLFDLDGNRVRAKHISTRFGSRWALCNEQGQFTGEFLPYRPARESTLAKRGYREDLELVPAKAEIMGGGRGLAGCASCYVGVKRLDGGYPGCPRWEG